MIKQYLLVLILTYIEYFTLFFFLEYRSRITWDDIKFWLKYPPYICVFFLIVDKWIIATMIYITFFFPYILMLYCIKNVNKKLFSNNKILIHTPYEK